MIVRNGSSVTGRAPGRQEAGDHGREQVGAGHQLEVAAVVDVQPRAGDQRSQDPGVGQRDDRVVVAREHQAGLADERQERQRGPPSPAACWYR